MIGEGKLFLNYIIKFMDMDVPFFLKRNLLSGLR